MHLSFTSRVVSGNTSPKYFIPFFIKVSQIGKTLVFEDFGRKERKIGAKVLFAAFQFPAGPKSYSSQQYVNGCPAGSVADADTSKLVLYGI